jgi:hypothetical protein
MRPFVALCAALLLAGCSRSGPDPLIQKPFTDDFNRSEIGPDYYNSGAPYHIENGTLIFSKAHNHPLWLKRRLPHDVRIDFDCKSLSPDGDIKVEVFGDGKRHESAKAVREDLIYTASGYVFIMGGWHNARSVLVRENEHTWQHDSSIPLRTTPRVVPGQQYHWTITRKGAHLDWQVDGKPFLSWTDPSPLAGPGHDHFAFDGWESTLVFDNLKITPL